MSERTNRNLTSRNTLVQLLALYTNHECCALCTVLQTDGRTDGRTTGWCNCRS